MQASRSLTQEQQHTLESVYTFIRGATVYLEAHRPVVRAEDEPQITNLLNFGGLCQSRLVEQFPEIAEWEQRGGAA
jgi:hypothetical protein